MNESYFTKFLIHADSKQARILLKSTTRNQVKALSEIALNLNSLDIPSDVKTSISKYKTFLAKLSKKNMSVRRKQSLVSQNTTKIHKCIVNSKEILMNILEE